MHNMCACSIGFLGRMLKIRCVRIAIVRGVTYSFKATMDWHFCKADCNETEPRAQMKYKLSLLKYTQLQSHLYLIESCKSLK